MNNNLNSLNNYLFEQLERLNDDEELEKELKRAKAITGISTAIVNNAKLVLDVKKYADELGITNENEVLKLKEKTMNKYTKEQKEFLINNNYMKTAKELAEMFNKKFKMNLTPQNIKTFRGNHKLNSGLTGRFEKGNVPFNKGTKGLMKANKTSFKKGNIPSNHKKVGYERINVDGYIEIKVKEPNIFKLKHRVIYEQYYGKIPKGHKVIFADGNKLNIDPNNLILVTNSEELIMNKNKLRYDEAELTRTGSLIAKVIDKTHKVKNDGRL